MNNRVRTVFNRRKQASDTTCAAVEIVVCLGRERFYFSIGIFLNATQWLDGKVINHPKAAIFNEQIQKKVTEFERIKFIDVSKGYIIECLEFAETLKGFISGQVSLARPFPHFTGLDTFAHPCHEVASVAAV